MPCLKAGEKTFFKKKRDGQTGCLKSIKIPLTKNKKQRKTKKGKEKQRKAKKDKGK